MGAEVVSEELLAVRVGGAEEGLVVRHKAVKGDLPPHVLQVLGRGGNKGKAGGEACSAVVA